MKRPIAFVLAATDHGTMIVNRNDFHMITPAEGYGVGHQILTTSSYDLDEARIIKSLLDDRRIGKLSGVDKVVVVDVGANIGAFTIDWARHMTGWGTVLAIEAQERLFYALAGNIAINNCDNAMAIHVVISNTLGVILVPRLNYNRPASFGSLEVEKREMPENIGQPVNYHIANEVDCLTIDSMALGPVDLIKLDIEGMELKALQGAAQTIEEQRPILVIEIIKSNQLAIVDFLQPFKYVITQMGMSILAIPEKLDE